MLKEHGIMRRANSSVCGIRLAISEMTGQDVPIEWKKFFDKAYKRGKLRSRRARATSSPAISRLANEIHEKRLENILSHAIVRKTKKPTKPIKFNWLRVGERELSSEARKSCARRAGRYCGLS